MSPLVALLLPLALALTSVAASTPVQATTPRDSNGPSVVHEAAEPSFEGPPEAFDLVCDVDGTDACEFKVCEGPTCTIMAFDGERFVAVGKIENADYLIEQMTN